MKKAKLTRSLMAAVSIVALSAVMYGCVHSGSDPEPPPPVDSDGDGVPDADDAFPNDADETMDTDGDGVGDNADAFPNDADETMDTDGDGVGDNADAFPNDADETMDADGNGIGDNADAAAAEATALATAKTAAQTAEDDARAEWRAARAALSGIIGMQAYNPVAYQLAQDALADARAAYDAAAAANAKAQAATTSADAMKYRRAAEMALADAESANMVAMAQIQEVKDVPAARMAAMAAVTAAKAAYDAAKMALAEVEANKADDMESYDTAAEKVAAAKTAYEAAMAAAAMADAATTSAAAKMAAADAEAERDKAQAAQADAEMYAGMVTDSHGAAEQVRMALDTAQKAAMAAATAAMGERDAAQEAIDGLEDKKADDIPNYTRAMDQLNLAKAAYMAAKEASDAAAAAMATADGVTEAEKQQGIAEAEQAKAAAANKEAMKYAALVVASYDAAQRTRQSQMDEAEALKTARMKATEAATDARAAATAARAAANKAAELQGATSVVAIEAATAATAAEAAATAAEAAKAAADEAETSAEAMEQQEIAENKRTEAQMRLAAAQQSGRLAQVGKDAEDRANIATYREQALDAKTMAMTAAMKAREYANKADMAADEAEASARHAMMAKTDYATAKEKADAARAAATAAAMAATAAEEAAKMAEAEYEKAKADGVSVDDAKAARDMARAERNKAVTQRDMAMARYDSDDEDAMGAMQLAAAAKAAGGTADTPGDYKLKLLAYASGQDETTAAAKTARVRTVADWIAGTIDVINDDGTVTTDKGGPSTATDPGITLVPVANADERTADNTVHSVTRLNTGATTAFSPGSHAVSALVQHEIGKDRVYHFGYGATHVFRTDDMDQELIGATTMDLPMLGGFTGVELSGTAPADSNAGTLGNMPHFAHIYTDYDVSKRKAKQEARNVQNAPVVVGRLTGQWDLSTPGTYTLGTDDNAPMYDHDGDPTTPALVVSALVCESGDCSVSSTGAAATATITALGSGFRISGSAEATGEMGDPDYLTFGYWLDGQDENAVRAVGAFASGNMEYAVGTDGADLIALTGTATYRGSAAGLHSHKSMGEDGENWVRPFDAKAMLTANFGTAVEQGGDADADQIGSISGKIYDINSGGTMLTGDMSEIILGKANLGAGATGTDAPTGSGTGATRMGAGTGDADTGMFTFKYNGNWDYRFFGPGADVTDAAMQYPGSVGGTFAVTGTDDMGTTTGDNAMDDDVTQSFIGAFGAHRE